MSIKNKIFIAAAAAVIGLAAGFSVWYRLSLRPAGADRGLNFIITRGERSADIAQHLQAAGIIRSASAFTVYVTLHSLRAGLQAGSYTLSPGHDTPTTAAILSKGLVDTNRLIIPEGLTVKQITALVQKKGIAAADFTAALGAAYADDFLASKPAQVDLEGYLFPDSYDLTKQTSAASLAAAMLANFGRKLTPDLRQAFAAENLSLHQGVTLASIVEREVPGETDRAMVAGVFLNRLAAGLPLESDVTVQYGADQLDAQFSVDLDSPYNTYKNKGLPIGPICNPGLSALTTAAHPAHSDFLYFLAGKDGQTHYARTFAEHQANIAQYLN